MEKIEKLSMRLLVLWIVCFLIFSIGSSVYVSYQQAIVGADPTVFVSGYHWLSFGIITMFFIPLLCIIRHLSKISASIKLHKVVSIMLIWLVLSTGLLLFCIVFAYVAPDTFTALTSTSK